MPGAPRRLGADVGQLRIWADSVQERAGLLEERFEALRGTAQGTTWHGPDADGFRERWETWLGTVGSTVAALRADGEEARTHAEEQDAASSADGAADGASGGGAADERGPEDGPQVQSFIGGWSDGGAWFWQEDRDLEDDIPLDDPAEYGLDSMNQAGVGNCMVVATSGALSEQDPEFIQEHIRRIDDETYEVTLYDENGDPVVYTVEDRLTNKDPLRSRAARRAGCWSRTGRARHHAVRVLPRPHRGLCRALGLNAGPAARAPSTDRRADRQARAVIERRARALQPGLSAPSGRPAGPATADPRAGPRRARSRALRRSVVRGRCPRRPTGSPAPRRSAL